MQTLITKGDESKNRFPIESDSGAVPAVQPRCIAHWERVREFRVAERIGLCGDCLNGKPILARELTGDNWASRHRVSPVLNPKSPKYEYRRCPRPRLVAKHTPEEVIRAAAAVHGVQPSDLRFHSNSPFHVYPRGTAAYLLRRCLGMSLNTIGRAVGGFHHSTILALLDKTLERMEKDREYRVAVEMLAEQFSAQIEVIA